MLLPSVPQQGLTRTRRMWVQCQQRVAHCANLKQATAARIFCGSVCSDARLAIVWCTPSTQQSVQAVNHLQLGIPVCRQLLISTCDVLLVEAAIGGAARQVARSALHSAKSMSGTMMP